MTTCERCDRDTTGNRRKRCSRCRRFCCEWCLSVPFAGNWAQLRHFVRCNGCKKEIQKGEK